MIYKNKALKRNSTFGPEFRELLGGVKQQKEHRELALEQLPEIKVGADGGPPLQGKSIRQ